MKKVVVISVIALFICVGFQPVFAVNLDTPNNIIDEKKVKIMREVEPSGLFWGTYTNCTINGWHYGMYPRSVDGFALVISNFVPFESCILNGTKGKIAVKLLIGFGFSGIIDEYTVPREEQRVFGSLLYCIYLVDRNPAQEPYDITTTQDCGIK